MIRSKRKLQGGGPIRELREAAAENLQPGADEKRQVTDVSGSKAVGNPVKK